MLLALIVYTKRSTHPIQTVQKVSMLRNKKSGRTAAARRAGESTVEYDSSNHFEIIFQARGSVWPKVIKFCLLNVLFTLFCYYKLKPHMEDRFKMTGKGKIDSHPAAEPVLLC